MQAPTVTIDDQTERLSSGLESIINSVVSLKRENMQLMMVRDAAQIHLFQLQQDTAMMKALAKKLRAKFDQMSMGNIPTPLSIPVAQPSKAAAVSSGPLEMISFPYDIQPEKFKPLMKLRYAVKTDSVVCTAAFTGNGEYFAFANTKNIFLVNTADGSLTATLEIPGAAAVSDFNVRAIAISSDSQYLAVNGPSKNVLLYSIPERKLIKSFEEHSGMVSALMFLNDSQTLVSGCFEGVLCVWDLTTMTLSKRPLDTANTPDGRRKGDMIVSLTKDADESFVGIGFMNGNVGIHDAAFTPGNNSMFTAHSEAMLDITTSPFDCAIATSSHDNKTKIWSLRHVASCKQTLIGHDACVLTACFSPLATLVFTGSKDETIRCWNYKTGELQFTVKGNTNTVFKIVHHPTEKMIISCSGDQTVSVWEYSM